MKKNTTQKQKAAYLGISQSYVNQICKKTGKMSWSLAERLSRLFPEKGMSWWRKAPPNQIEEYLDNNIPIPKNKEEERK